MRRAVVAASIAISIGGCGEAVDAPPTPDGAAADAGEPAAEAGPDGGRNDAAPDAPVRTGYCATVVPPPRFCDSFDDGMLANGWDQLTVVAGSQASLETLEFRSGPASFAVDTPILQAQQIGNVSLRTTIPGTGTRVRFAVSAYFSQVSFTQGALAIATVDVSSSHYFNVWLRDTDASPAASLEEISGSTTIRRPLTALPAPGTWTRLEVDIDLAAGTATLKWDGATAVSAPVVTQPAVDPTIRIGAVYAYGPAPSFSALYDDLVLDF